jgi:NADPH:quinone reductase-like Zn-dependent oxidoreductase
VDAAAAGVRSSHYKVSADGATLAVVSRLLESGDVKVFVDQVFRLDEAARAHEALETGHTRGKIVLTVSEV